MSAVARVALPDARHDRLYFAQVREDPLLELAALRPAAGEHVVVVSSGGCTALSLLAAGAGRVTAVDLNATQNHLVELKAQVDKESKYGNQVGENGTPTFFINGREAGANTWPALKTPLDAALKGS